MSWPNIIERIQRGEIVEIRPPGNSMTPIIRSKQLVRLEAVEPMDVTVGDVVLARVAGRYYLHLVTATEPRRVQISNNHGHVNGWATRDKIYAIVTQIGS